MALGPNLIFGRPPVILPVKPHPCARTQPPAPFRKTISVKIRLARPYWNEPVFSRPIRCGSRIGAKRNRHTLCTVASESSSIDEQLLREQICPSACLVHSFSKSRVYLLPTGDTELSTAFEYLTDPSRLGTLGIQQWGLSQTTLEEAFIRIVNTHS